MRMKILTGGRGSVCTAIWSSTHVAKIIRASIPRPTLNTLTWGRVETDCDNALGRRLMHPLPERTDRILCIIQLPLVHVSDRLRYQRSGTLNNACGGATYTVAQSMQTTTSLEAHGEFIINGGRRIRAAYAERCQWTERPLLDAAMVRKIN